MLKGRYDEQTEYQVGDVVVYDDGRAYRLRNPAKAGVPPVDTGCWSRLDDTLSTCAMWIIESMEALKEEAKAKAKAKAPAPAKTAKGGKAK